MFKTQAEDAATNVETDTGSDAICAYDTQLPTSSIHAILTYWQTSSPLTLTCSANDVGSGLADVELFYRYSGDNSSWSSWLSFASDSQTPWEWTFNFPSNDGYYEFYSVATDIAGNVETGATKETGCGYDTTPPSADAGSDQNVNEGTTVTFDASGSSDNIGIATYTWTFTDTIARNLQGRNPTYTFNREGTFLVTLNVTDLAGNSDTDTVSINVIGIISTGTISGRITDENGDPVEGVTVKIDGMPLQAMTNATGHYRIVNVPAGMYNLTATKDGYVSTTLSDVSVSGGQETQSEAVELKKSREEEEFMDSWWLILLILAIVVIVILLLLLAKPKKKAPEKFEDYQPQQPEISSQSPPQAIEHEEPYQPPPTGPEPEEPPAPEEIPPPEDIPPPP
jgi:hypothetical protein